MSPRSQTFDSNGPDVRVRGNAHQVYEKYLALARDASSSGDRIAAEGYFQFAEHYFRVLNDSTDPQGSGRPDQRRDRQDRPERSQGEGDGAARSQSGPDGAALAGTLPQGESEAAPSGNGTAEEASEAAGEEAAAPATKPRRGRPRRRAAAKANGSDESAEDGESKVGEDAEAATT